MYTWAQHVAELKNDGSGSSRDPFVFVSAHN
jgi:hypothetical protein